jgi:hypothetical protein
MHGARSTRIRPTAVDRRRYERPLRAVTFKTEGWSRDVTEDLALKVAASRDEGRQLSKSARGFVERATRREVSELVWTLAQSIR